MKLIVLYRPNSEYSRVAEEYIRDFQRQYPGRRIEVINMDSRDGVATASLYDVVQFPAILAVMNDGQLLKSWEGSDLPLQQEVASYTQGQLQLTTQ